MAKKNRIRNEVVYIAREGDREELFLCFLQELFDPEKKITLRYPPEKGGTSNAILDRALRSFYSVTYAWFDEDDELDDKHKEELEKRWNVKFPSGVKDTEIQSYNDNRYPIIIVSHPFSVEGILIRLFDKNMPNFKKPIKSKENFKINKKMMKSAMKGIFGKIPEIDYYKQHLTKEKVMRKARDIEELKLLLGIFHINIK